MIEGRISQQQSLAIGKLEGLHDAVVGQRSKFTLFEVVSYTTDNLQN